ncbi:MAG: cation-translocating P-type ATPase [Minisyncoccia bacterium]|jgi:Mg2+-importing ATPase
MEEIWKFAKKNEEEILEEFKTSLNGLTEEEAKERLKIYGPNIVTSFKIDLLEIIKRNTLNFFNGFLFLAGLLSLLINGPQVESILIFFFLFISIFIAVFQDYRTNKLSEKLLSYFENYAFVKRNRKWIKINAKELVPGDYVKVTSGYLIPADVRILKAKNALVDESIITGESEPVFKNTRINTDAERINTDCSQTDSDSKLIKTYKDHPHRSVSSPHISVIPENIALMGTTLIKGEIEGIVIATGGNSYFGKIAKATLEIEKKTAYQKMMTNFAKNIGIVGILSAFFVILVNIFKPGYVNFKELVIFAIVLSVAIVPEFLPAMTILALSVAGYKLARRGLVIKRLSSIEDLGAVEILCTDKTGTITTNELKLQRIITEDTNEFVKYFLVDYYLTEELTPYEKAILKTLTDADYMQTKTNETLINPELNELNTNEFEKNSSQFEKNLCNDIPDKFVDKNIENLRESVREKFELIEDLGFDPNIRIRRIIVRENGEELEIVKGAPENVIEYIYPLINADYERIKTDTNHPNKSVSNSPESANEYPHKSVLYTHKSSVNYWLNIFENEDKNGCRTLALAIKKGNMAKFLGIASFLDPLKDTAIPAINLARNLNLEIKILTGDSLNVAKKVAWELGLIEENEKVVLGEEIRNLPEEEAKKIIKETKVFARVLPEDKLKILEILQKEKFVAFLGEGINDAPGLKIANVAIAVDSAVDVVKQEADIILKEKDLKTIVDGIYEGRKTLENIGKYIKHTMSDNFGNLTSVAILTSILPFVPLTPLQVLLTNFLTDLPLIAFASDNVKIKEIKKPIKLSSFYLILLLLILGFVAGLINIIGYLIVKNEPIEVIRTFIFFLTTMTGIIVSFLIRTKDWFILSKPSKSFFVISVISIILTFILTFISPFKEIFAFAYLNQKLLIVSIGLLIVFIIFTELSKKLFYKKYPDAI